MKFKKEYFTEHPERTGEEDKEFEKELYIEWLEDKYSPSNDNDKDVYDANNYVRSRKDILDRIDKKRLTLKSLSLEDPTGDMLQYEDELQKEIEVLEWVLGINW